MTSKRALLVGINYFGQDCELGGCIKDAQNAREMLLKNGYLAENIMFLHDDPKDKTAIRPTRANMLKGFEWLVANTKEGDKRFFHYSGHGSNLKDKSGEEHDGYDECLCPLDYDTKGPIIDDDVRKLIIDKLPYGCDVLILLDCCHSGSGVDLRYNYVTTDPPKICGRNLCKEYHYINEKLTVTKCSPIVISGCRDEQTSADATIDGTRQGAMSASLWHVMKKHPVCSYKTLLEKMRKYLKENGYDQVPQLSSGEALELCDVALSALR